MTARILTLAAERAHRTQSLEQAQQAAWAEYVRLQAIAKATLRLEDGLAAGRAWGNFIDLFVRGA